MIILPEPTEAELKPYNKVHYFERLLIHMDIPKLYNVSHYIVADWISQNYDSWFLNGKGLTFKK